MDQYRSRLLTNRPFHGLWRQLGWGPNKTNCTIHWTKIYPMHSIIHLSNITGPRTAGKTPLHLVYLLIFLLKTNDDMVCKVMKFFIDACIVEEQFVSTNTQISVCKICRVLSLLASDGKLTNLKVITGNSHSLIKTSFNQNCKKWKGLHWHLAWTCTSQTCFTVF